MPVHPHNRDILKHPGGLGHQPPHHPAQSREQRILQERQLMQQFHGRTLAAFEREHQLIAPEPPHEPIELTADELSGPAGAVEAVRRADGWIALRSAAGTVTEYRPADEWRRLLRASLHQPVLVAGGVNEGTLRRYEVGCTVRDPNRPPVRVTGPLYLELCGPAQASGLLSTLPGPNCELAKLSLHDLGYKMDPDSCQVSPIAAGLPRDGFVFWNLAHERVAREALLRGLWELLEQRFGLARVPVPGDPLPGVVLASSDWESNDKMLVIVCGLGLGRSGSFGKRLALLGGECGTMIPQVRRARAAGMSVVLMDPNAGMEPFVDGGEEGCPHTQLGWAGLGREQLLFEERDEDYHMEVHYKQGRSWGHCRAVWDSVVAPSAATRIAVMGHSAGGSCLLSILHQDAAARARVRCVVFSDCYELQRDPRWDYETLKPYMKRVAKGWYLGGEAGEPIEWIPNMYSCSDDMDFECVSSGAAAHNLIPQVALGPMFEFIDAKLNA